jgi:hypothetical protein
MRVELSDARENEATVTAWARLLDALPKASHGRGGKFG